MGYAPWEMRDDPKFWVKRLHPEDAPRVFAELDRLIGQGGGTVEYRFRHRRRALHLDPGYLHGHAR